MERFTGWRFGVLFALTSYRFGKDRRNHVSVSLVKQQTSKLTVTTVYNDSESTRVVWEDAIYSSLLSMPVNICCRLTRTSRVKIDSDICCYRNLFQIALCQQGGGGGGGGGGE